uniref:SWIM-type domain-containing protein n=1 Tax=Romanomermis culicivorax TaxID=13658 RepID=A0A915IGV8_ROMCU
MCDTDELTIKNIVSELLKELETCNGGELDENLASMLLDIFGPDLVLGAMNIAERRNVITDMNNYAYAILPKSNYCRCKFFESEGLFADRALLCIHTMAVKLSEALKLCQTRVVDDKMINTFMIDFLCDSRIDD